MKITTKLPSPVTCVTHKRFVVLTDDAGPIGNVVLRVLSYPRNEVPEQVLLFSLFSSFQGSTELSRRGKALPKRKLFLKERIAVRCGFAFINKATQRHRMTRIIKIIPSGFWMISIKCHFTNLTSKNEHEFCFGKSLLVIEM